MKIPILSRFTKARDKPTDYYKGADCTYLFGPTTSGKSVNEFTAMQTTAVYACVRILAEAIASLMAAGRSVCLTTLCTTCCMMSRIRR